MIILSHTCLWTMEFPLNCGSHPRPESGFALAKVCAVNILFHIHELVNKFRVLLRTRKYRGPML